MSAGLLIIGEICPYCCKFRSPMDIIPMLGGAKICIQCEQRHIEALNALSTGTFTGECSECGKKPEEMKSSDGSMAIHFENGRYRAMCNSCDQAYVLKRMELYGGTQFARDLGQ